MRIFLTAAALSALALNCGASYMDKYQAVQADPKIEVPDSTGFKFTDVKVNKTGSVKDQNKSGTCWAFSGTSMVEEDLMRKGKPELDLSEMWTVRNCYIDKAKKYISTGGKINFAQGGSFADVIYAMDNYGAVPEEVYAGLNYGEDKHSHYEMAEALTAYLDAINKNPNKKLSTAWLPGFIGILDAYLGPAVETFTYNGKTYTPQSFAKEMNIVPDEYVSFTSYTHHPFYKPFALEIADNWLWSESMNIPMEEMKRIVDEALDAGFTVGWAADVSEKGFKWRKGYALLPEKKAKEDMDNAEVARWTQLSDSDRDAMQYDIKGPVKERTITQEDRQRTFENRETTDDHGMVIVGYATDQDGNRYYKVKNSWDTNQLYDGYLYVSEPYFLEKTLNIMLNKAGVPKDIAKKVGL
ncbi:MAG: C1 family peptidase [Muribaculaceae bacterium]|nr:C1 family peptidase [Muribaculaceae bacterium]